MKRSAFSTAAVILCAAMASCGDLTNQDLVFVAALPDSRLAVSLPSVSGMNVSNSVAGDALSSAVQSATKLTTGAHNVIQRLGLMAALPPSGRDSDSRVWGPASLPGYSGVYTLSIALDDTVACGVVAPSLPAPTLLKEPGYRWTLQAAPIASAAMQTLAAGTSRGMDFGTSCGALTYNQQVDFATSADRTDDDPTALHFSWDRSTGPGIVSAIADPSPSEAGPLVENFSYLDKGSSDGEGSFTYVWRYQAQTSGSARQTLQGELRWGPSGTPWRADYEVLDAASSQELSHGLSCGSPFGTVTFKQDGVDPAMSIDDSSALDCAFDFPPAD